MPIFRMIKVIMIVFSCREVSVRDLKVVVSKAVMPRDMRVLLMQVNHVLCHPFKA